MTQLIQISGLNIAQSNFGAFQAISSIFVFSISSPIGIAIGMVLANMEKSLAGDIANGILQVPEFFIHSFNLLS